MRFTPNQPIILKLSAAFCTFTLLALSTLSFAQKPVNDLCDNAIVIQVSQSNLGIGAFIGQQVSIDSATREIGEQCAEKISELGNCGKTVWYTFSIGTTRDVAVVLKQQDSSIPQIFAGFTIYKIGNCDYNIGNISEQLTPIGKFGTSGNSCLQAGTYYVQVSAREKSKGILWTEINISEPADVVGNRWFNLDKLGVITDKPLSRSVNTFCLSIDTIEFKSNLPLGFTKSYWIKLEFRADAVQNLIDLRAFAAQLKGDVGGYRIFKNALNLDSVKSNKPYNYFKLNENVIVVRESCKNPSPKEIVYLQIVFHTDVQSFNLTTSSNLQIDDKWNSPDTDFEITTHNKFSERIVKYFNCAGVLANHRCNNIPDSFIQEIQNTNLVDTFRYGAYVVVKSQETGELTIAGNDIQRYRYSPILYVLYKGDIRSGCDLIEIQRSDNVYQGTFCVEEGVYTILVTRPNHYYRSTYIELDIQQRAIPKNVIAYKHDQPAFLGNVKPSENKFPPASIIHIHSKDTTVELDTFKKTGRFTFREFYLEEDGIFNITLNYNDAFAYYLFKGQFSNGTASLLSGENYSIGYKNGCEQYKAGYYTILTFHDTANAFDVARCELAKSDIRISLRFVCSSAPANSKPSNATAIYDNQNLLAGSAYKSDISFTYPFDFCIDCHSETAPKDRPIVGCSRKPRIYSEDTLFFYYTFYLAQNAEVELTSYSILFQGDAKQNPSIILDSFKVIDPCNPMAGNIYCNLKGGQFYTMVIYNPQYLSSSYRKIVVTPHQKSVNDYAINSRDLGKIELGQVYKSPYDVITCHTYFAASDPCAMNYSDQMRCAVPIFKQRNYLDTINKGRPRERQNLWYTFTVADASNIHLKINSKDFCRQRITVFQYIGDYQESFSQLQINGFDSSRNGLLHVAENGYQTNGNCRLNTVTFQNAHCIENRYFVLIDGEYAPNASYQMEVSKTASTNVYSPGDQCANASKISINKGGNYNIQTKNHCHSYGGSPFEDEHKPNLKSTWFEIDITKIQKYDLGILFLGPIKINSFTIYAGNCEAMTKIVELNDQYSYFNLSCMGIGKYYIQVITDNYNVGDIKFKVMVEEKPNAPCKPYNFDNPLSGFELGGGCNNDTIWFNNQSTKGKDISYSWYLNEQLFSQLEKPILIRPDARLKDNNQFSLVVTNQVTGLSDTSNISFINDTTKYYVKIQAPTSFNCLDTFNLSYKTNYPYKLNLFWDPSYRFTNPYANIQEMTRITGEKIFLTATSENCILHDSIHLKANKPTGFFIDEALCDGSMELTYDISQFSIFRANGLASPDNKTYSITEPGNYILFYNYNGCTFYDTIDITVGRDQSTKYFTHDTTFCIGDTLILKSPKLYRKYDWGNNNENESLTILNPGNYSFVGEINSCAKDVHSYSVKSKNRLTNFLKDTAVCRNDWYHFVNPYPDQIVLYKNPDEDSFLVVNESQIELHLQDSFCVSKADATISVTEHPNENKETTVCFDIVDGIWLDAKGKGTQSYNWLDLNSFEPLFWAETYKQYAVQRTNLNGCKDTLNFDVLENCPVNIYIPNAFSPNTDGINSAFKPFITGTYESYHLLIFNRWGEQLLNQTNGTWDGTYLGQPVPAGVYSVIVQVKAKDKITKQYVQTLTVLL